MSIFNVHWSGIQLNDSDLCPMQRGRIGMGYTNKNEGFHSEGYLSKHVY